MMGLLALQARRDRIVLAIWVGGLALLLLLTVQATAITYGTPRSRREVLGLALTTPALLAFRGVPDGNTLGSAVHFQAYSWLAVAVALMNTFLAVRHGRGDEVVGRRELLDATPVSRLAAPTASLLLAVGANVAFGLLAAGALVGSGLPGGGSALMAAGLALTGLGFFGIGLLASEIMPTSRGANGLAVVAVLLAYAARAAGDAVGHPDVTRLRLAPGAAAGLSPIGWGEALRPFTHPALWPLLALVAFAIVPVGAGLLVHARREVGSSAVRQSTGPAAAPAGFAGPLALAWRLQRPAVLWWTAGAAVLGAVTPALASAVSASRLDDAGIRRIAQSVGHSRADTGTALTAGILVLIGVLAAAAGIQGMLRAREEEVAGRAEVLLAGAVPRARWLASWLAVSAGTVVAVLLGTAAALALGTLAQGGADATADRVLQTLVQAPSALALTGGAALLVALLPRIAVGGAWLLLAGSTVVGLFGGVLRLPDALVRFTPVGSVPALPTADWGPTWCMGATAVVVAVAALGAIRRRSVAQ